MNFFDTVGKLALGSRLRLLTDKITEDAGHIYGLYGIDMHPKWFPVFYILSNGGAMTIGSMAKEIGHSHASVSKIIGEMSKKGIVKEKKDQQDGRRNWVSLSEKGKKIIEKIQDQYKDVGRAIDDLSAKTRNDLWKAIEEWEFLLDQKTLLARVQEQKKQRESQKVQIIDYSEKYQQAFKELNEEWISTWFQIEEADHKALDNPQKNIIDKGGHILVALYDGEPVGVCALLCMNADGYDFELAKMAVAPRMQGRNIGWLLGNAIIQKARSLGASKIYLESNTRLTPAINLYHKLGFSKTAGHPTPYERCNIQMELILR
jgi:DNA-binding MarR family transcriptional regulator/N-acetylglutamate synthase-like GNAT family acetyltransferase